MRLGISLVTLSALLTTSPAAAQAPEFLSPNDAVKLIMDGRPWNSVRADGRKAKITLNRDGTGTAEGPITFSISWEIKQEDICINLRMAGIKCVRFRPVAGGYQSFSAGNLDATFTR